jgi:predicted ribosomally synthesized peptide with nif11-like leader
VTVDATTALFERLETDEAFATALAELREDPVAVQAAIKDAGYLVTPEEARTAFLERFGSMLTEEQLAAVAGGLDEGAAIGISAGVVGGVLVIGLASSAAAI